MSEIRFFYRGQPFLKEQLNEAIIIGSAANCDITLSDCVAPRHLRIEPTETGVVVVPLDGAVTFNSQTVVGSHLLNDTEIIDFGNYRLQYLSKSIKPIKKDPTLTINPDNHEEPKKQILPSIYFLSPFKKKIRRIRLILGRDPKCEVVLDNPYVSSQHAEIYFKDGKYFLRDLGSRNGTYLNDYRIMEVPLPQSGNIRLGHFTMVYDIQSISTNSEDIPGIVIPGAHPGELDRKIVFRSEAFTKLFALLKEYVATDDKIMLVGETGVGKDLIATYLHHYHPKRRDHRLLAVNAAAIQPHIFESQLFGHVKGSFSGAISDHRGFFEQANHGTLFLDEIGDLPPPLQTKLLRVIEDGIITPVGGEKDIHVDVRLIAATNKDLRIAQTTDEFRKDLFWRFDQVIPIPNMSERIDDIEPLIRYLINQKTVSTTSPTMSPEALRLLKRAKWPGNIRQITRVVRAALTSAVVRDSHVIGVEDLPKDLDVSGSPVYKLVDTREVKKSFSEINREKREKLPDALKSSGGIVRVAARLLDIAPKTVYEWCSDLGLNINDYRLKSNQEDLESTTLISDG